MLKSNDFLFKFFEKRKATNIDTPKKKKRKNKKIQNERINFF